MDNPLVNLTSEAEPRPMRRLHYAGGQLLTADTTCKAVLRYARALADSGTADVVSVPVVGDAGAPAMAHLLIGPASQMFSTPVAAEGVDEPADRATVDDLEARTRRLAPSTPAWPDEMADVPVLDFEL
jgi:hypothetical protein